MYFRIIFFLLAWAMPALYLNKAGISTLTILALLFTFVPIYQNRKDIFNKKSFFNFFRSRLTQTLLLFLGVALASSFMGVAPEYSVNKWWQLVGVALVGFIFYAGLSFAKPDHFKRFLQYCYWSLAFFSTWALIDHLKLSPEFTAFIHGDDPRLTKFSSVVALMLPFAMGHTLEKNKAKYWVVPLLAVTASFACGGRSGWIAIVISFCMFYFSYPWETVIRKRLNRDIAKVVFLVGAGLGFLTYKFYIGTEIFMNRITLGSNKGAGGGRLDIWQFALEKWTENPWFGIGVKGFRNLDFTGVKLASTMHPHNAFIEVLLETGIVGLTVIVTFIGLLLWRLGRTLYQTVSYKTPIFRITAICALSGFIAYCAASLTLTSIFHAYWLTYFVILVLLMDISRNNIILKKEEDYTHEAENHEITKQYPVAVSVVMPCHNSEKYLASAIESVLAQTFTNWELIIANNGSTDASEKIADEYAEKDGRIISLKTDKGLGVGLAKNMGVEVARGRYIAFLDSDDKWTADKLEKQISFMEKSGAPLSGSHYYVIDDNDNVTGSFRPSKNHVTYYSLLKANDIGCLTSVYDTHQLGKMYMTATKVGSDLFLWLDMLKKKPFAAILHEPLGFYRIHDGANTKNKNRSIKMRWKLIFSEKDVGYMRGFYYFCWYAVNGVLKSLRGRFGR